MKIFIYKLYDTSGKIYYGSTKSPKKRFQLHLNNAIKNYACSSKALNHLEWKMEI
jgi:predicted GIY-YIG superfamily endonuclease